MAAASETLESLATLLAKVCGTSTVAVWSCTFGRIELRYSTGLAQPLYNTAHLVWRDWRPDLQDGRTVCERGINFVPLLSGSHDLVGVLALNAAVPEQHPGAAYFSQMLRRIARHVQQPMLPAEHELLAVPVEAVERSGGIDDLLRHALEILLVRHGWNVALVASMVGLARPTLAARLRRLGLRRPSPSTKARPRRPAAGPTDELLSTVRQVLWPRVEGGTLAARRPRGTPA